MIVVLNDEEVIMAVKKSTESKKTKGNCSQKVSPDIIEKIREKAYFIWENKGRPENSSSDDWLEAERQLRKKGVM